AGRCAGQGREDGRGLSAATGAPAPRTMRTPAPIGGGRSCFGALRGAAGRAFGGSGGGGRPAAAARWYAHARHAGREHQGGEGSARGSPGVLGGAARRGRSTRRGRGGGAVARGGE